MRNISVLSVIVYYSISRDVEHHISRGDSIRYRYLSVNSDRKELSEGIITVPRTFIENESKEEYFGSEKNEQLIYDYGITEYRCTGLCYCDNDRRSSSHNILIRGMSFLLSSLSVIGAYEISRTHFEDECKMRYSDQCSEESIFSEVTNCKSVSEKEQEQEQDLNIESSSSTFSRSEIGGIMRFYCEGNCVVNKINRRRDPKQMSEAFPCEDLKQSGEVDLDTSNFDKNGATEKFVIWKASKQFSFEYLSEFCKLKSEDKWIEEEFKFMKSDRLPPGMKDASERWKKFYKCVGGYAGNNKSVKCRRI